MRDKWCLSVENLAQDITVVTGQIELRMRSMLGSVSSPSDELAWRENSWRRGMRCGSMELPLNSGAPVGKKKRALMPSTPLRRRLRAHGHTLHPLVRIGKDGITPGVLKQVAQALFDHELCKIKLESECPVDRFEAADELGGQPGTNIVQILGRTVLVYKRHPQNPRFEGPRARGDGAPASEDANAAPAAPAKRRRKGRRVSRPAHKGQRPARATTPKHNRG